MPVKPTPRRFEAGDVFTCPICGNRNSECQCMEELKSANHTGPSHYRDTAIQPWDAMEQWMPHEQFIGFLRGNAIKYLARAGRKGDQAAARRDYEKAEHYQRKLNETLRAAESRQP